MSRSSKMSQSPALNLEEDLYGASPPPSNSQNRNNINQQFPSPSPVSSVSSDKENRSRVPIDKGKGRMPMGSSLVPADNEQSQRKRSATHAADPSSERDRSRRRKTVEVEEDHSEGEYNPDQDPSERRQIRKGLRDLGKSLADNRAEYLAPTSTGLRDTLLRANELAGQVRQTSDATIDSRLLVTAADFSLKKTVALISGNTAQGVDIDELIMKAKAFMRRGDDESNAPSATQRHRRPEADEDDDNDGEPYNWSYLARFACIKHNSRPSVPGFLYGPLSIEKRARKVVVRKAAFRPKDLQETRPEVLKAGDIQKDDNKNLTTLCTQILSRMRKVIQDAEDSMDAQEEDFDAMTVLEQDKILDTYAVSRDQGVAYYRFVINPKSFGQTVENMFYVSFLIRDGNLGLFKDDRGLPYLQIIDKKNEGAEAASEMGKMKHQAVLPMSYAIWEELISVFKIKEPMILHREEDYSNVGAKGWYA